MKNTLFILALLAISSTAWVYPEQLRLSWTENENEMRVTWVTYWALTSTVAYREILCRAPNHSGNFIYIQGAYKSFNEGDHYDRFQYIHTAVIQGLRTECYYEYFVQNLFFTSKTYVFSGKTPDYSAPYDLDTPVKMIVFGDLGIGPIGEYTNNLLGNEALLRDFDGILHIGDIAYDLHNNEGETGDIYFRMVEHIVANYAYMTLPGNHEGHHNFTHYKERLNMPLNEANQGTSYFYSFDMGRAHFIMYNTEVFLDDDYEAEAMTMVNWLREDLEKANKNRENRPWIILGTHHPLYCSIDFTKSNNYKSNSDCGEDTEVLKPILEDLFYENGVDLLITAHVHNYERDAAIYKNQTVPSDYDDFNIHINPKAPVHIVGGNAGNYESHNDPVSHTPQEWARYLSNDYGYGRVIVYNSTHLYWEQFSAQNKEVIDYLWIIKNKPRYN
jgi:hypothetical protein